VKAGVIASRPSVAVRRNVHSRYQYKKVLNGRKQPIRGLWERNGTFIARIAMETVGGDKENRWVPLEGAETRAGAETIEDTSR
jgi:hypothetical protein